MKVAQIDPIQAFKVVPEAAGAVGVLVVTILAVLFGAIGASSSPAVQQTASKAKDKAVEAKDKAAEGVATGAEKASAELNKRTTRSGGS